MERKRKRGDFTAAFAIAARVAQSGDVEAQAIVANMYLKGSGVPHDRGSAAVWLERAASGGHAVSMVGLAKLQLAGHGPDTSLFGKKPRSGPSEALRWAQASADAGLAEGKSLLAFLLQDAGIGAGKCGRDTRTLLEEASAADDPSACLQLAVMLRRCYPHGDPEVVTSLLRRASHRGLPLAVYLVGIAAETGLGCARDGLAAARHFEHAAELGVVSAQVRYGCALLTGRHLETNFVTAETWLRKAAAAGDCRAASLVGNLRAGQDGLPPDFDDAARWFLRAARLGDAAAARIMALMHLLGLGVAEDPRAAAAWIVGAQALRASSPHDPAALLVEEGLALPLRVGVQRWFEEAAMSGNSLAAYRLGVCLAMGTDAAPDYDEAARWLQAASSVLPAARLRYGQLLATGKFGSANKHAGQELIRESAVNNVG